uniref:HhH-GPD domain-containing protein n=1 Tax=Rhizophora mucronata TaxID=61149 RepID=A0A2P2KM68_RHIMU
MDIGQQKQKEIQVEGSWIPQTPVRPIRPNPPVIYTDQQGNQLVQSNWLGPEGFSPSSTDGPHVNRVGACFANTSGTAFDGVHTFTNDLTRWKDVSFTALLANANAAAAAAAPANFPSYTNGGYSLGSQHIIHGNYVEEPWYGKLIHEVAYGLNFHLGIMEGAVSNQMASHFVPVTPDKSITAEHEQVMEIQSLCFDERKNKEINEQNQITTVGVDNYELCANNELRKREPDSSLAGVSELMESHNSDKVAGHAIDLNKTPQQKPRRKKHRPKVITEGKPRIQKPVTPKPPSNETPTSKRKYVRRNAINKASSSLQEKRKYVRKKLPNRVSTPAEAHGKSTDVEMPEPAKTCRRALNFDTEKQNGGERTIGTTTSNLDSKPEQDDVEGKQSKLTVQLSHGIEVIVENTQSGIQSYDLNCCASKMLESCILQPARQAITPISAKTIPPQEKQSTNFIDLTKREDQVTAYNIVENSREILLQTNTQMLNCPNSSNCSTCTTLAEDRQAQKSKRRHSSPMKCPDTCSTNLIGMDYNALSAYQTCWVFPSFSKKKRTEKVQCSNTSSTESVVTTPKHLIPERAWPQTDFEADPSTSRSSYWLSAAQADSSGLMLREAGKDFQLKPQAFGCISNQTQRSTKKRSKVPTRARDLASGTSIAQCMIKHPTGEETLGGKGQKVGNSNGPHACMEIPIAQMHATLTTKKRTKKRVSLVNLVSSNTNQEPLHRKPILYKQNQFLAELPGDPCKEMSSIEVIAEQLKHLDLSGEDSDHAYQEQTALVPYSFENEKQNAVVHYERDGTIVPFPIKKQRPRPKVDLDEETNRVWKLLMVNINSEGIDGADEEKTKWWEEERNVFRGRANSFIARMHQVQGDRRFSQWKGSVVDSVIGVFLTQNVSDHLSSSAFMSLAACFPLKTNCKWRPCHGEGTRPTIDKSIVCILEPHETIQWDEEMSNQLICDQSSITLRDSELGEERDVVNSSKSYGNSTGMISSGTVVETYPGSMVFRSATETNEKCYVEEGAVIHDAFSSQNSVISSQNSLDSPTTQTAERKELFSESNLEAEYLNSASKLGSLLASTSFMELLQKADPNMLHEVYIQENYNSSSDQNSKDGCQNSQNLENINRRAKMDGLDGLNLISHLEVQEVKCLEMTTDESIYSNIINSKGYKARKDHCSVAVECGSHIARENKLTMRVQEASSSPIADNASCNNIQKDKHIEAKSQIKCVGKLLNESRETLDVMESTSALNMHKKNPQNSAESDSTENAFSRTNELSEMIAAKKAKSRRVGNEIKDDIDWDSLRKQAEANGGKRERSANTMDSLDWEAVRCADVNEIADTIKERGMNNLLAERIKDFLDRLVTEHGSIDLEWLRDVPPDKAKEYLLSIRGLGLKSVECVRLLTLHQLAFPVDTNVGRIAVRLGWVPLQPLPESLQLHLLELYPVLESIQKYLWPRLCKLDQKTLYELHYQMITFGKVFCTKSKPNCNACPLRGECRHFASAFASARLALPGPEEKSLVSLAEGRTNDQIPTVMVNQVPLLLPQATRSPDKNQQWEDNQLSEARCSEPIIEEPSSPEPDCRQLAEIDIEDSFCEDPDEIPTIKLDMDEFTQNLQNYMQENMELQESEMSKALVALTAHAASIPTPKLKNVSRLRTEHQVYELPDSHPLLEGLDKREPDDPCSYLLAIWTPGETADSIEPPERKCSAQEHGKLCDEETCFSCNSMREANSQTVRGTLLIPCRTAMRGSFPLNGTYFQVNEVFADHDSSLNPIAVPRAWIWQLQRKTVYFGTSVPTIFKGNVSN